MISNRLLPALQRGLQRRSSVHNVTGHRQSFRIYGLYLPCSLNCVTVCGRKFPSAYLCTDAKTLAKDSYTASAVTLKFDSVIAPDLSIEEKFSDLNAIEANVRRRNINLDARQLHSDYCQFLQLEKEKYSLERQRRENADTMKHVMKEKGQHFESESNELKRRGKLIRDKLKQLQNERYHTLYKRVVCDILKMPIDLHPDTPDANVVCSEFGDKPNFSFQPLNHLSLGQNMRFLNIQSDVEGTFYLLNEAAILEHHLMTRVAGSHLRAHGLQQFVCPDMVKAFVVEGCGFDVCEMLEMESKGRAQNQVKNSDSEENLGKSRDHNLLLTGVSCFGFAAYLSAMNIQNCSLPLKYYSVGRNYIPVKNKELGLYSASQANCAAMFGVAPSAVAADRIFDEFLSIILSLYKKLRIVPFRVVQVGASNLRLMEAKRVDFYVWSAGFGSYFKLGELRLCNDYISRRLAIRHYESDLGKGEDFCSNKNSVYTVDGVIIKFPSIVASLMESFQSKDGTCSMPKFN